MSELREQQTPEGAAGGRCVGFARETEIIGHSEPYKDDDDTESELMDQFHEALNLSVGALVRALVATAYIG